MPQSFVENLLTDLLQQLQETYEIRFERLFETINSWLGPGMLININTVAI